MTKGQRIALQSNWWPAACTAQGWKVSDRDLRLRVCAWSVNLVNPSQSELLEAIRSGRQPARMIESTNDLNQREDVDRVKACLGMLADRLKSTGEVGHPEIGSARRKRDVIRAHLKCLALFQPRPREFLASLVEDMFNHGRPGMTIRDLTDDPHLREDGSEGPSDLHRLVMRMAQAVNDRRKADVRHLTIHELKRAAGVDCDCAACLKSGDWPAPARAVAPENWADFEIGDTLEDEWVEIEEPNPF